MVNPGILEPLRTRQVNIWSKELKFMNIGYYWDEDMVDKVAELLCK